MSRLDKVRICMIGAGSLANAMHYPSLAEMEDVEIAALCDLDAQRSQKTAERFNVGTTYPTIGRCLIQKSRMGYTVLCLRITSMISP